MDLCSSKLPLPSPDTISSTHTRLRPHSARMKSHHRNSISPGASPVSRPGLYGLIDTRILGVLVSSWNLRKQMAEET